MLALGTDLGIFGNSEARCSVLWRIAATPAAASASNTCRTSSGNRPAPSISSAGGRLRSFPMVTICSSVGCRFPLSIRERSDFVMPRLCATASCDSPNCSRRERIALAADHLAEETFTSLRLNVFTEDVNAVSLQTENRRIYLLQMALAQHASISHVQFSRGVNPRSAEANKWRSIILLWQGAPCTDSVRWSVISEAETVPE